MKILVLRRGALWDSWIRLSAQVDRLCLSFTGQTAPKLEWIQLKTSFTTLTKLLSWTNWIGVTLSLRNTWNYNSLNLATLNVPCNLLVICPYYLNTGHLYSCDIISWICDCLLSIYQVYSQCVAAWYREYTSNRSRWKVVIMRPSLCWYILNPGMSWELVKCTKSLSTKIKMYLKLVIFY